MEDLEETSDDKCDNDDYKCTIPSSVTIKELSDGIIQKFDMVKYAEEDLINTGFREYTGPSGLKDSVSEYFGNPS